MYKVHRESYQTNTHIILEIWPKGNNFLWSGSVHSLKLKLETGVKHLHYTVSEINTPSYADGRSNFILYCNSTSFSGHLRPHMTWTTTLCWRNEEGNVGYWPYVHDDKDQTNWNNNRRQPNIARILHSSRIIRFCPSAFVFVILVLYVLYTHISDISHISFCAKYFNNFVWFRDSSRIIA